MIRIASLRRKDKNSRVRQSRLFEAHVPAGSGLLWKARSGPFSKSRKPFSSKIAQALGCQKIQRSLKSEARTGEPASHHPNRPKRDKT